MKKLIEQYSEHNKFQIDGIETFLYMVGEEAFFNKIASFYPIYKELFKKDSVYRIFKTDQKKYKKLYYSIEQLNKNDLIHFLPILDISNKLIRVGFSPDKIFNKLNQSINKIDGNILVGTTTIKNIKQMIKTFKIRKDKGYYDSEKFLNIFFNPKSKYNYNQPNNIINLVDDLIEDLKEISLLDEQMIIEKKLIPRKYNSIYDIHQYTNQRLLELKRFDAPLKELKPREDLLNLHNKTITVDNKELRVYIAKTNHDLMRFSLKSVFDNCVGRMDSYLSRGINGYSSFLGIFENDKPLYCIETDKYCIKEAKGVSNQIIPKGIKYQLENLLTLTPEVPEDFTEIKHNFIFGYKYNLESNILYLMFKQGGIYEYNYVDEDLYNRFVEADYKGKNNIFHNEIRNSRLYPYQKIAYKILS